MSILFLVLKERRMQRLAFLFLQDWCSDWPITSFDLRKKKKWKLSNWKKKFTLIFVCKFFCSWLNKAILDEIVLRTLYFKYLFWYRKVFTFCKTIEKQKQLTKKYWQYYCLEVQCIGQKWCIIFLCIIIQLLISFYTLLLFYCKKSLWQNSNFVHKTFYTFLCF